jgi:hypothetical protein
MVPDLAVLEQNRLRGFALAELHQQFCLSNSMTSPSELRMATWSGISPGNEWVAQPKHGS